MRKQRSVRATITTLFISLTIARVALAGGKTGAVGAPLLSCAGSTQVSRNITVCAPATGLPAGFSLQWMSCDAYAANGSQWLPSDDARLGAASFSGNANSSRYRLAPGQCVTVDVGDFLLDQGASTNSNTNLACGTCYVFRAFGHATSTSNRSAFTPDLNCSTLDCGGAGDHCTSTPSAWRASGPPCDPGADFVFTIRDTDTWPLTSLILGSVTYSAARLSCILDTADDTNGLIALAHQLIAAKLNAAKNGSLPPGVAACVSDADALIGSVVVPPIGTGFLDPGATSALTTCLANYNAGAVGPGACVPPDPGSDG